jgi:SAM-dependent methyltransferase
MSDYRSYPGKTQLFQNEIGLIRYTREICRKFHNKLDLNPKLRILEFGAGTGFLASILKRDYNLVIDCLEIDLELVDLLRKRGFTCHTAISELPYKFDAIYSSNVLEHIEGDLEALRKLNSIMEVGGKLAIHVPAHMLLFSGLDKHVGHYRRYSKSELKSKVEDAGFIIDEIFYDDVLGFFVSFLFKFFKYNPHDQMAIRKLKFYDKIVYPISQILDRSGCRFILGKNLFLIAKKS